MPSRMSSDFRNSRAILFVALLVGVSLAPGPVNAQSPPAIGNPNIYVKPFPAPVLPPAGGSFVDPTFGTKIVRITDPSNATYGTTLNSAAQDSMFNSDGSLFYLHHQNAQGNNDTFLYSLNRATGQATRLGALPTAQGVSYDGATWDPLNPNVLYALEVGRANRALWQFTFPLPGTAVRVHDFSVEIPTGGYPYSRVGVAPDGRYFAITASTTGGQDEYDYVVVWDRQTGAVKVLNTTQRLGTKLHSMVLDNSGQYAIIERGDYSGSYIWHWPTDALSVFLPITTFGGHKIPGNGQVISPSGIVGGEWDMRSLPTPTVASAIFTWPRKSGKVDWFEDSHSSRILKDGSFLQSRYVSGFGWGTFIPHAGSVYKLVGLLGLSGDFDTPEVVRYKGLNVPQVAGIPTGPNQWWYNGTADTLYLWLSDGSNPQANRAALVICDWRPLMEEIVRVAFDGTSWNWRRLAHHRTHYTGAWNTTPRANADPTGTVVLFKSNWDNTLRSADGSYREDAFVLLVPPIGGTAPAAPSGLRVSP